MSKTANEASPAARIYDLAVAYKADLQEKMLELMRKLKPVNPGDAYLENYLGMIEKYGEHFLDTYHILRIVAARMKPKRILEIGTRTGISTCQFLEAHPDRDSIEKVVCVDPFDEWTGPNIVRANLKHLGLPSTDLIKIHPLKSADYFRLMAKDETFDFILVDGDHDKAVAREDLTAAHLHIEQGGIIVFDDVSTNDGECGLIDVWEDWKSQRGDEYHYFETLRGKGVAWAIRK